MSEIDTMITQLDNKLASTDDPIEISKIYYQASLLFEQNEDIDEACFFMTQAFVFASHYGEKSIIQSARKFLQTHNRI